MTPDFGSHRKTTSRDPTCSVGSAGCVIVRVKETSGLQGPGVRVKKLLTLGNFGRTCHFQMPVPLRSVGVATFEGMSTKLKGDVVLFGG